MRYIKPGYYDDLSVLPELVRLPAAPDGRLSLMRSHCRPMEMCRESLAEGSEIPLTGWRDAFISMTGAVRF